MLKPMLEYGGKAEARFADIYSVNALSMRIQSGPGDGLAKPENAMTPANTTDFFNQIAKEHPTPVALREHEIPGVAGATFSTGAFNEYGETTLSGKPASDAPKSKTDLHKDPAVGTKPAQSRHNPTSSPRNAGNERHMPNNGVSRSHSILANRL